MTPEEEYSIMLVAQIRKQGPMWSMRANALYGYSAVSFALKKGLVVYDPELDQLGIPQ